MQNSPHPPEKIAKSPLFLTLKLLFDFVLFGSVNSLNIRNKLKIDYSYSPSLGSVNFTANML